MEFAYRETGGGMKNDIVLYQRIYQLLKNQIECGLLPEGKSLPSRAKLCREFQVSEKTVRRVLEEMQEKGLIETRQGKRPVVRNAALAGCEYETETLQEGTEVPKDIFNTGRLFCDPVIEHGIARCAREDWEMPAAIIERMNPSRATEFWRLSHYFWRFFVARNENDLILHAVKSLGFFYIEPLPGPLEMREAYWNALRSFVRTAGGEGYSKEALLESMSGLYGFGADKRRIEAHYRKRPDAPWRSGCCGLEQSLRSAEERYSHVYMDIIGLIAIGRYQPGDQLPTHKEMQMKYGVSSDTTAKAIRVLREWGIVTAKRGCGIYVSMDLTGLKNVKIAPDLIGCHLRRFLDSLELLDFTIDKVAEHAAEWIPAEAAGALLRKMERLWNEEYLYQITPMTLLEFITDYIQYAPLKEIYRMASRNYHIGRCIPKLVTRHKSFESRAIQRQAVEAVECLIQGDGRRFSEKAAAMFGYVHGLVLRECGQLGYLEIADRVYDGSALWKRVFQDFGGGK